MRKKIRRDELLTLKSRFVLQVTDLLFCLLLVFTCIRFHSSF